MSVKNTIKVLGVAAALGVAAMPLCSYADSISGKVQIDVTLPGSISLKLDDHAVSGSGVISTTSASVEAMSADLTSMSTSAKVSLNQAGGSYTLTLIDEDNDTSLKHATLNDKIDTAAGTPTAGTASWAVSIDGGTNWIAMVPQSGTPIEVASKTAASGAVFNDDETVIKYGVATSGAIAAGTYSDTVVYTVTAN